MKRRTIGCGALLAAACLAAPAAAQDPLDDAGLWFAVFGNGPAEIFSGGADGAGSPWLYWFDAHYRLRDDSDGFNQSIVRPGLGYRLTDEQVAWAGYAWIRTRPTGAGPEFDEHRFWQQWTATPSAGDWRFLHRSRFEQRWFEDADDVALRWRQLARAQRILTTSPQWSAVVWDEVFFNLNDTDRGIEAGLDQNRVFIGVGFKHEPDAPGRWEAGYLNQFLNRQGGADGLNHILSLNYFF